MIEPVIGIDLGGDDFDNLIVRFLVKLIKDTQGGDVANDKIAMASLKNSAEKAKVMLSTRPFASIEEDHLTKGVHPSYELSRTKFQDMIKEYLEKTIMSVTAALEDAKLRPRDIDKILLVGGSTRIPMVSELLKEKLGIEPHLGIDPDLCVALGAGIQAGREMGKDISSVVIDITPYTFGTSAFGEIDGELNDDCFVPLIKRNTKLPASRTEAFQTVVDYQKSALIKVFQGENKNALDNILIGSYLFDLSKVPAGSVITLKYDLDLNGILKLEAVEKDTGKKINMVLENVFSNTSQEQIIQLKNKINTLYNDNFSIEAADDEFVQKEDTLSRIAETLQSAQEKLGIAPDEDKDEIINLMEDIKLLADKKDFDKAIELSEELEDILFYID
ncbi:MAG: Hsp70 family protein [Deltaproteobacteria bacterium]|nr:Hsp70 family protein [Deltaproteobacteria bacterium]